MKKIISVMIACAAILLCCTKDPSLDNAHVALVTVDGASSNMQVSAVSFRSNDWLNVDFSETTDSIGWWISDTATNPYDTVPYYPGGDTVVNYPPVDSSQYPHGDTIINYPPDTTHYPHDTIPQWPGDSSYNPPTYDSSGYPHDTIVYPPHDSIPYNNNGYAIQVNGNHLRIQINKRGNYLVMAMAYRRNTNGSYTVIKTGYVKLSAH